MGAGGGASCSVVCIAAGCGLVTGGGARVAVLDMPSLP